MDLDGEFADIKYDHFAIICRFCLQKKSEDNLNLMLIMEDNSICEMFERCTGIKISSNDKMPQNTCFHCLQKIRDFNMFREKCIKSQSVLENVIEFYESRNFTMKNELTTNFLGESNSDYDDKMDIFEPNTQIDENSLKCSTLENYFNDDNSEQELPIPRKKIFVSKKKKCKDIDKIKNNKHSQATQIKYDQEIKSHKCPSCGKEFKSNRLLKEHIKTHSDNIWDRSQSGQCPICGKLFVCLQRHIVRHKKNVRCSHCEKVFWTQERLQKHINTHHRVEERLHCHLCDGTFSTKKNLEQHIAGKHFNDQKYACDICGKRYNFINSLRGHKLSHVEYEDRPHQCDICQKKFTTGTAFNRHYRIHTNDNPYKCKVCEKGFRDLWNLKEHSAKHTKERPYSCKTCGLTYTQKSSLNTHLKKCNKKSNE